MRWLLERLVKLQSTRTMVGSVAGLSNVTADLLMFTASRLDGE
jgi:hypothetical protein